MKHTKKWLSLALAGVLSLSLLAGCSSGTPSSSSSGSSADLSSGGADASQVQEETPSDSDALVIAEQGIFSAGGTVIQSDGTFDVSNYYTSREGSTAHVDHANVLYRIPEDATGLPMVFLHGYG